MTKPTKITAWQDRDGVLHASVEDWQKAEMRTQIKLSKGTALMQDEQINLLADDLITNRDEMLAILTTGPRSKPRARKTPGTTNPKRATKAQARDGFRAMRQAAEGGVNATRDGDVAAEPSEPVSAN